MILVITVAVRRNYDTASASFLLSETSQYAVTMIQRPRRFFFLIRHSTQSLWYNVRVVSSFWYLTVHRHYVTTSGLCLLSDTSQYTVTLLQRRGRFFFLIRYSTPSQWYNVGVVSFVWYVTLRSHYDTTLTSFILSNTS